MHEKKIRWDLLKNKRLKQVRGASFEEVVSSKLVAIKRHPAKAHQSIMLFEHRRYIWVVPYAESETEIFLKTMYPSRKFTKLYPRGEI